MCVPWDTSTLCNVKNEILVKETFMSLQKFMSPTQTNNLLRSMNNFMSYKFSLHKKIVIFTLGCLTI
jgi:hypothetical protein